MRLRYEKICDESWEIAAIAVHDVHFQEGIQAVKLGRLFVRPHKSIFNLSLMDGSEHTFSSRKEVDAYIEQRVLSALDGVFGDGGGG